VVDRSTNAPVGGATVTLRSGSLQRTVLTPTVSGSAGLYQFEGLDTPGSYVLTLSAPGYTSVTRALELGPGESSPRDPAAGPVPVLLDKGQGIVTGTVTTLDDAGRLIPLGGVVVTVTNATFTANTSTLTGGVGDGTYTLTGLPTPGSYTVSFAAPGFQTEFVNVQYLAPGSQTQSPTLSSSDAQVKGTVLVNGVATGGVRVALSDGIQEFATTSSDSPAGLYSLVGVPPGTYTLQAWVTYKDKTGVILPPAAVQIVHLAAGQRLTQTIDVAVP
jgi:hypothetical protein